MFDFFKKKQQIHDVHWDITTSDHESKLLIRRVRSEIPKKIYGKRYKHLLVLSWEYEQANDSGMPTATLKTRMDLMENVLQGALEAKGEAILVAVITCNGKREWYWYGKDINNTKKIIRSSLHGTKTFKIDMNTSEDSTWTIYQQLHCEVNQ